MNQVLHIVLSSIWATVDMASNSWLGDACNDPNQSLHCIINKNPANGVVEARDNPSRQYLVLVIPLVYALLAGLGYISGLQPNLAAQH
jgi:hypothetical protein